MSGGFRVRLLCEDHRSERFLVRLCEQHGIRVLEVEVAPKGRGSAADWVRKRYPEAVRKRRSKNFQAGLGLVVHIDGDNEGVVVRKAQLAAGLEEAGQAARAAEETVAVLVPTWCIETWLLHLAGLGQPAEDVQVKVRQKELQSN